MVREYRGAGMVSVRFFLKGMAVAFALLIFGSSCSTPEKLYFDIPRGYANRTLKEFARQAEVEIVFRDRSVDGIQTNAVEGYFESFTALGVMVEGTDLEVAQDAVTGAYAVTRVRIENDSLVMVKEVPDL